MMPAERSALRKSAHSLVTFPFLDPHPTPQKIYSILMSKRDLWKFQRPYHRSYFCSEGEKTYVNPNSSGETSFVWHYEDWTVGNSGFVTAMATRVSILLIDCKGYSTSDQHSKAMQVLLEAWKPNLASQKQTYWTVLLLALFSIIAHHLSLASASIISCTFDCQLQPAHTTKSQLQPSHPGVCLWSESCVFGTPASYDKLSASLPEYRA